MSCSLWAAYGHDRITDGNFRHIQRVLSPIERIVQTNALRFVTKEVVEVAREQLVIGFGT
ncbi:MAG TPA: hypothetical protein DDW33_00040 [Ktedonobacter sp.]|nr:hypothetical protein [Ktedonobacter sp.]HBE24059.1 hypothetical protein [Ktedonobacter sp.]HCP74779.1 hypothetical protein [Ktedonobacter sp.]